jgi:hypothetical protein
MLVTKKLKCGRDVIPPLPPAPALPPVPAPPPPLPALPPVAGSAPPRPAALPPLAVDAPPLAVGTPPLAVGTPPLLVDAPPLLREAPPLLADAPPVSADAPLVPPVSLAVPPDISPIPPVDGCPGAPAPAPPLAELVPPEAVAPSSAPAHPTGAAQAVISGRSRIMRGNIMILSSSSLNSTTSTHGGARVPTEILVNRRYFQLSALTPRGQVLRRCRATSVSARRCEARRRRNRGAQATAQRRLFASSPAGHEKWVSFARRSANSTNQEFYIVAYHSAPSASHCLGFHRRMR